MADYLFHALSPYNKGFARLSPAFLTVADAVEPFLLKDRHAPADKQVHQTNQVRLGITCRAGVLSRLSHLAAEVKTYRETFRLEDYTPGGNLLY